jgi:myo-inositol-1(or 4)-monophosphatase
MSILKVRKDDSEYGELEVRSRLAHQILDDSRSYLLDKLKLRCIEPLGVSTKPGTSPLVTDADQWVENFIRKKINEFFPEDSFIGEETGTHKKGSSFSWVVDPIDGTSQFARGVLGNWGTLIAIMDRSNVVQAGFLDLPRMGERWSATCMDDYTLCNGSRVINRYAESNDLSLKDVMLATTSPDIFVSEQEKSVFDRLSQVVGKRVFGGDCSNYVSMISSPFVPLILCEATLNAWDIFALKIIIDNAGGVITDWSGKSIDLYTTQVLAAPNHSLHAEMLQCIASY